MSSLSGTTPGTVTPADAPEGLATPPEPVDSPDAAATAGPGTSAPGSDGSAARPAQGLRPDVVMLQKAQAGDRGAYGQIVVLYQDRLYNAVLRLVGDREEARELTQEAFTRGLEKIDSFRGDASPYTWLFRIAANSIADRAK